jgi:Xaa-Pro aminopeptidase
MRNLPFTALLAALLVAAPAASPTAAQDAPLFTRDFPPEEFAQRRERVYDAIGPDAVAIIQGEPSPRGYVRFRQSNEFYYLSGIEVPHAYLLLDGANRRAIVFLPHRDARRESSEGRMLSADEPDLVRELSGIDAVAAAEELSTALHGMLRRDRLPTVYTLFKPAEGLAESRDLGVRRINDRLADAWDGRPSREAHFMGLLRERLPGVRIADLHPVLDGLRLIKSPREMEMIRRATRLSVAAIEEAMRSVEPGVVEREIDALAKFIYYRDGAQGDAYYSLVASGPNAWYPHYHKGARTMQPGELLLMDYAPDVGYYMSDITRMMPVDGRFTDAHRALYGFYERAYRAILDHIRPGATPNQVKAEAVGDMREALAGWTFAEEHHRAAAEAFVEGYAQSARGEYGSLGHFVGMATHDVGTIDGPLREGMVFTIEPALRVPEEQLYIRMEDLIIIHADRAEIVSIDLPMSVEDIEALMAEPGLLQTRPSTVMR